MIEAFLFRLDMAKDNEQFLSLRRQDARLVVFAGSSMKVGLWTPDFVEVVVDHDRAMSEITLIELEASESVARANCRKYLPESSTAVIDALVDYLDVVCAQCRTTADSRLAALEGLRTTVMNGDQVRVSTAGALRSSIEFVEKWPLIDQPVRTETTSARRGESPIAPLQFAGVRRVSRAEGHAIRRAVRILHCVIVGQDHWSGTLLSWRNQRVHPLEAAINRSPMEYPSLRQLLLAPTTTGTQIDCDAVADDLSRLWSVASQHHFDSIRVAALLAAFIPTAAAFAGSVRMPNVFEGARAAIATSAKPEA